MKHFRFKTMLLAVLLLLLSFSVYGCTEATPETESPRNDSEMIRQRMAEFFNEVPEEDCQIQVGWKAAKALRKEIGDLLTPLEWQETEHTADGVPELIVYPFGNADMNRDCFIKVYRDLVYASYSKNWGMTPVSYTPHWYQLTEAKAKAIQEWTENVQIAVPFEDKPGTPIFEFLPETPELKRLMTEYPREVTVLYEEGVQKKSFTTTEEDGFIDGLRESFSYLRVLEEEKDPAGDPFTVLFKLTGGTEVRIRFKGETLETENTYYQLFTGGGFFENLKLASPEKEKTPDDPGQSDPASVPTQVLGK